jgi:hypothetical protein
LPFAQISARDLDDAIVGQLPAAQLRLDDKLEPRSLEVECLHAAFRRRRLIEDRPESQFFD